MRFVRKLDNSHELSCDHDNLPGHFNIVVVTELFRTMKLLGVGMDNQGAILNAAACAKICSATLEKDIQWLLP